MSKKQVKNKPVKKASKPSKKAVSRKKGKPAKAVNASKQKKAVKPAQKGSPGVKKTAVKKTAKKIVPKKTTIKKAAKPVAKKAQATKKAVKKTAKPLKTKLVKKVAPPKKSSGTKKVASKPKPAPKKALPAKKSVAAPKKAAKPSKPVKKAKIVTEKAPVKAKEKELLKKTSSVVATLKTESPKPAKAEKPRRSKKAKKAKDDEDEPAIENDPLIEEIIRSTKKRQQQPKKPKIIQTFVNPMASLAVAAPESGKKSTVPKKEPKGKFELEYVVRTSASILYEFLTSPSGLSEWFADDVNIRDGIFTFYWDGSEQKARLLNFKDEKHVRMQWVDKPEGTFFEFRIEKDELTGDISLMIIDFADEGSDLETSKRLWDSQVNKLLHVIGSY